MSKKQMSKKQRLEWKQYRAACRISNVEICLADFLAREIPSCVLRAMGQNERK